MACFRKEVTFPLSTAWKKIVPNDAVDRFLRSSAIIQFFPVLPDLISIKSGRACLPPAGAFHAPARQARPDLPGVVFVDDPLPDAFRLWATDRVIVHWTIS